MCPFSRSITLLITFYEIIYLLCSNLISTAALGRPVYKNRGNTCAKIVLHGDISTGKRNSGAPRKIYSDSLKKSHTARKINLQLWEAHAADHVTWRRECETRSLHLRQQIEITHRRGGGKRSLRPTPATRYVHVAAATRRLCPGKFWSVTSAPATDMDDHLLNRFEAKSR